MGTGAATATPVDRGTYWIALGVLAALAILVGGWVLLVSPKKAETAMLREQAAMQAAANARSETHLEVLRSKAEQVPDREAYLQQAAVRIPQEPAMPDLLRALSGAAASAGVTLVSVVPGVAIPVGAPASAPAPPVPAPPAPPAAAPPAPAGSAPAPPAGTAVPASAGGLRAVPLTLEVLGSFYEVEQFLADLEDLPRALRVTNVALTAGETPADASGARSADGRALSTRITGSVFTGSLGPSTAGSAAGASPPAGTEGTPETGPAPVLAGQPAETTS